MLADLDNLDSLYTSYTPEKLDLYQEKSLIIGSTFRLDKYSEEFLKKLFENVKRLYLGRKPTLFILYR